MDWEGCCCSTTGLPRPVVATKALAENCCEFMRGNGVLSAGKGVHGPADAHADQQEEEERPYNVFHAVQRPAAAQKAERDGNDQREKQHRLKMAELEFESPAHPFRPRATSYACNAASRFSTPAVARNRVP